jgi:hypothetical protein
LFQFTGPADGAGEPPVKRVAACDLHEAIAYMRKWHPGLDMRRTPRALKTGFQPGHSGACEAACIYSLVLRTMKP